MSLKNLPENSPFFFQCSHSRFADEICIMKINSLISGNLTPFSKISKDKTTNLNHTESRDYQMSRNLSQAYKSYAVSFGTGQADTVEAAIKTIFETKNPAIVNEAIGELDTNQMTKSKGLSRGDEERINKLIHSCTYNMGKSLGLDKIQQLFGNKNPEVRLAMIDLVDASKNPENYMPQLEKLFNDTNWTVSSHAYGAYALHCSDKELQGNILPKLPDIMTHEMKLADTLNCLALRHERKRNPEMGKIIARNIIDLLNQIGNPNIKDDALITQVSLAFSKIAQDEYVQFLEPFIKNKKANPKAREAVCQMLGSVNNSVKAKTMLRGIIIDEGEDAKTAFLATNSLFLLKPTAKEVEDIVNTLIDQPVDNTAKITAILHLAASDKKYIPVFKTILENKTYPALTDMTPAVAKMIDKKVPYDNMTNAVAFSIIGLKRLGSTDKERLLLEYKDTDNPAIKKAINMRI